MPRTARATLIAFVPFLCAVGARPARAQAPEGADRLGAQAIAESLVVLKRLDDSVRVKPPSAAAWFHQGMLAWALWERSRHQPPANGLNWQSLASMADTSLRHAVELDAENALYLRALAQFLIADGVSFRLYGPYGEFNDRLRIARASGNAERIADAASAAGRVYWVRYNQLTGVGGSQADPCGSYLPRPPLEGVTARRPLPKAVGPFAFLVNWDDKQTAGEIDYLKAELLYREAYEAGPDHAFTFRRYAMLLADQMRWREVAALARDKVTRSPADAWGWLVLGLATLRQQDYKLATAAFDTALMRLEPSERTRLDRIERVLDPREAARMGGMRDSSRAVAENFYWRNADPLWSVEGTEPRLEFLARITFAELRWTEEELSLNGVNSDYGNGYVRTGTRPTRTPTGDPIGCKPTFAAWYVWNDTTVLRGPSTNWARIANMRVDSIPTQVVRFRGVRDSTDVVFAALPPTAQISRVASVRGPVRTDLWIITATLGEIARDSIVPSQPGPVRFVRRLAPGAYVYRTEASASGSSWAGRATGGVVVGDDARTGFTTHGEGISDLYLATSAEPRTPTAKRWSDFDIRPLVAPIAGKSQLSLVWENYEFGDDNGSAQYNVKITVKHDLTPVASGRSSGTPAPGRVGAGIIGSFAAPVRTTRTADQVEFQFQRNVPHAATIVENIAITLGQSPPGSYLVTMIVEDRVTGAQFGHTQRFRIPTPACKPVLYNPC